MLTFNSFLQTLFQFVKSLAVPVTKKMYRSAAVLTTGFGVITVVTFTSGGFGGGGKNALAAYEESSFADQSADEEARSEEAALVTEAAIQAILTDSDSIKEGQLLAGSMLVKNAQIKMANQIERQQENDQNQEEIRQIEEERARTAAEEEQKRAEEEARQASAIVNYSEEDYKTLLKIVEAEAGICDSKGRILVANVILNRVRSDEFPDTITEVVYQRSQFSPVTDGRLNSCTVTQKTTDAVNRALAGEDYSDGALFFMNRSRSKSHNVNWFDGNLTYLFHHDRHDFFK